MVFYEYFLCLCKDYKRNGSTSTVIARSEATPLKVSLRGAPATRQSTNSYSKPFSQIDGLLRRHPSRLTSRNDNAEASSRKYRRRDTISSVIARGASDVAIHKLILKTILANRWIASASPLQADFSQ